MKRAHPAAGAWVLIDAHNLLHQDPVLAREMDQPERARARLEELLAGRSRFLLFYDGGPEGRGAVLHRQGLRVEYAGQVDADDRLIAWLDAHPGVPSVVVSDDRGLRARARARGARVLAARGFLATFRRTGDRSPAKPEADAGEVDFWMRVFGANDPPGPPDGSRPGGR